MKYETRLTRVSFLLYTPNNLDHTFWKYFQECILSYIHPETHLNLRDYDLIEESGKALWGNRVERKNIGIHSWIIIEHQGIVPFLLYYT